MGNGEWGMGNDRLRPGRVWRPMREQTSSPCPLLHSSWRRGRDSGGASPYAQLGLRPQTPGLSCGESFRAFRVQGEALLSVSEAHKQT